MLVPAPVTFLALIVAITRRICPSAIALALALALARPSTIMVAITVAALVLVATPAIGAPASAPAAAAAVSALVPVAAALTISLVALVAAALASTPRRKLLDDAQSLLTAAHARRQKCVQSAVTILQGAVAPIAIQGRSGASRNIGCSCWPRHRGWHGVVPVIHQQVVSLRTACFSIRVMYLEALQVQRIVYGCDGSVACPGQAATPLASHGVYEGNTWAGTRARARDTRGCQNSGARMRTHGSQLGEDASGDMRTSRLAMHSTG